MCGENVRVSASAVSAPPSVRGASAPSVLRIQLQTTGRGVSFAKLKIPALRFILHGTSVQQSYELLFTRVEEIVVDSSPHDAQRMILKADSIVPSGSPHKEDAYCPTTRLVFGLSTVHNDSTAAAEFQFF